MILSIVKVGFVRGFGALSGLLLLYFVTQTLSVAESGVFSFIFTLVTVFGMLLTSGANQLLIKKAALLAGSNRLDVVKPYVTVCFIIVGVGSLSLALVPVMPNLEVINSKYLISLAIITSVFYALNQLSTSVLLGTGFASKASFFQNALAPMIFLIISAIVFYLSLSTISLADCIVIFCFSYIVAASTSFFYFIKVVPGSIFMKPGIESTDLQSLKSLFLVMAMELAVYWAGHLVSAYFLPAEELALFATALRVAMLTSFILIAVNLVVAPKFAQAYRDGGAESLSKITLTASRLMLFAAIPVLLFMILMSEELMSIFGDEYKSASQILIILACGQFVNVVSGSVANTLVMTNHERDFRNVVLITGPLAIILAVVLINQFGLIGAAYATSISVATQNLLAVWMVKKRLGFNTLNIFRKV
jgi:O-antigen/teichoic acid export membrane protein